MKLSFEKMILGAIILAVAFYGFHELPNAYVLIYRLSQYGVMVAGFLFMVFRWTGDPAGKWSMGKRWRMMALLWAGSALLVGLTFLINSQIPKNEPILLKHFFLPWVWSKFLESLVPGVIAGWVYGLFRRPMLTKNRKRLALNCSILGLIALIWGAVTLLDLRYNGTRTIRLLDKQQQLSSLEEVLSQPELRGKPLYVDLWFSSCKPCIEAFDHMDHGKALVEERGFAMLYLGRATSHPNAKQRWINVIRDHQLEGYHVYMSKELEAEITNLIEKRLERRLGYPHYLLINPEGEIVSWDAPGIIDVAELEQFIDQLATLSSSLSPPSVH